MRPGETIASTGYSRRGGGKGANQAVAVGRACDNRGAVKLSACIGEDGRDLLDLMVDAGVDVSGVDILKDQHTGRAIIQSSQDGENSIGKFSFEFAPGRRGAVGAVVVAQTVSANSGWLEQFGQVVLCQAHAPTGPRPSSSHVMSSS